MWMPGCLGISAGHLIFQPDSAYRGCQKKVPTAGKVPYHTFGFTALPGLAASESLHDGCLYNHIRLLLPEFQQHWCNFE